MEDPVRKFSAVLIFVRIGEILLLFVVGLDVIVFLLQAVVAAGTFLHAALVEMHDEGSRVPLKQPQISEVRVDCRVGNEGVVVDLTFMGWNVREEPRTGTSNEASVLWCFFSLPCRMAHCSSSAGLGHHAQLTAAHVGSSFTGLRNYNPPTTQLH